MLVGAWFADREKEPDLMSRDEVVSIGVVAGGQVKPMRGRS